MSHFYGTLQGSRGGATRCGTKSSGIDVIAASWRGCVRVSVYFNEETQQDMAIVELAPWRGQGVRRELYHGPVNGG